MTDAYINRLAATPKAFQILPVELNQEIACHLSDRDVVNFRASCREARDAIDDDDSFWFRRFHTKYDPTLLLNPESRDYKLKLRKLYQKRSKHLALALPRFKIGVTKREQESLKVVAALINDSFRGPSWAHRSFSSGQQELTCHNLEAMKDFIHRSDILENIFRPRPPRRYKKADTEAPEPVYSPLLAAVQLMCAASIMKAPKNIYGFNISQKWAYSTIRTAPIFGGFNKQEINMEWLLHILNFFKYHVGQESDHTLFEPFSKLHKSEKPLNWQGPLENEARNLGVHWKGTYAYLDRNEMRLIRSSTPGTQVLIDHNVDHGDSAIQTMNIAFPNAHDFEWPPVFEYYLHSTTALDPVRTRAQHRCAGPESAYERVNQRFQASGYDDEDFHGAGWLNQLPDQQGISGWKRMTMMKYFEDGEGGWDNNALWAYEGVVLPGGQIMLGRWWSPEEPTPGREPYTGPFIFWNTDSACDRVACDLHRQSNS